MSGVIWNNTQCPDATNSNSHGNTCHGHLLLPSITATATQANGLAYTDTWTTQNVTVHLSVQQRWAIRSRRVPPTKPTPRKSSFTAKGSTTDLDGFFSEISFEAAPFRSTEPRPASLST
ncbi:MAG: hypothetical protein U0350_18670 [Caldilineaceae bacterium]